MHTRSGTTCAYRMKRTEQTKAEEREAGMESILTSVKLLLGIAPECTDFDDELTMHLNMAFVVLHQLGLDKGGSAFYLTGPQTLWTDFTEEKAKANAVKPYLACKVRLQGFDPPQSSAVMKALENTVAEMEWRLREEFGGWERDTPSSAEMDYNKLKNLPTLDGVLLKGNVKMGLATEDYVDGAIGGVVHGKY